MRMPRLQTSGQVRPRTGLRSSAVVCTALAFAAVVVANADEASVPAVEVVFVVIGIAAVWFAALSGRTAESVGTLVKGVGVLGVAALLVAFIGSFGGDSSAAPVFLFMALILAGAVLFVITRPLPVVSQKSRDRLAELERRRDAKKAN